MWVFEGSSAVLPDTSTFPRDGLAAKQPAQEFWQSCSRTASDYGGHYDQLHKGGDGLELRTFLLPGAVRILGVLAPIHKEVS